MRLGEGQRVLQVLSAVLLTAFLCMQVGLAAHVHSGDFDTVDCLQCKTDTGNAALPSAPHQPALAFLIIDPPSTTVDGPTATPYRLSARGPPLISC